MLVRLSKPAVITIVMDLYFDYVLLDPALIADILSL